jgi:hypothetical protein
MFDIVTALCVHVVISTSIESTKEFMLARQLERFVREISRSPATLNFMYSVGKNLAVAGWVQRHLCHFALHINSLCACFGEIRGHRLMRWRFFGICFDNAGNYCNHVETSSRKSRRDRSSQLPCACRGLKLLLDQIFDTWIIWVKHICFDMKSFDYGGCSTGLGAGSDL